MEVKKLTLQANGYPARLRNIPAPPHELFYIGADPSEWLERPKVAVAGSRGITSYGRAVTMTLSRELAGRSVVIISGLALGVDGIAHTACLDADGITVAVLGGRARPHLSGQPHAAGQAHFGPGRYHPQRISGRHA